MKSISTKILSAIIITVLSLQLNIAGPQYANSKTKEIIEKMIEAHGGKAKWENAPSVSFTNIFFNPFAKKGQNPWWISDEIFDQKTRKAYHYWPIIDAKLAYDGKNVWTLNWRGNPPKMQSHFFYYFLNLPWLTQDDNVVLGEPGTGKLPGFDKEYITVKMTFSKVPIVGKTTKDSFELFIDPDSHILQGYVYYVGFGAILDQMKMPPEMEIFGPVVRVFQDYREFDGLLMPTRFYSTNPKGDPIYGHHAVTDYSFTKQFDKNLVKMPADAVIDKSSAKRQTASK